AGVRVLESLGLRVVAGESVLARQAYLAGSDAARGADLQRMLDDPAIRAVFCARGGVGAQRIIPALDPAAVRRQPQPVGGYRGATALLAARVRAGVVGIHGPMVAVDLARGLSARSLAHLGRVLADPEYLWEVEVPLPIRPGRATGTLLGGTLSVLATTLGTPYAPDLDGAILFLED